MQSEKKNHEVIYQGYEIINDMKIDIIDAYYKSLANDVKEKSTFMINELEKKYG